MKPFTRPSFDNSISLSRQIYDQLHQRICAFELKPYQALSEKLIAEEMGVSRTPVREALARLAEHNLVDILPQRGTLVAPLRLADLQRSQFMREAIELSLLRQAVASPERGGLVEALRKEIKLQQVFAELNDSTRFYQSDEDFHGHIASFVELPFVLGEIQRAKIHMDRFRKLMLTGVEDLDIVIRQHIDIVDAVERGDSPDAEQLMLTHLRRIFSYVDETVDRFPDYIEDPNQGAPARPKVRA